MSAVAKKTLAWSETSAFSQFLSTYAGSPSQRATSAWTQRTIVQSPRSEWFDELENKFNELTALPQGWDGYAGQPVSFSCAKFAAGILERLFVPDVAAPSLVPGADGTMQMEWHRNGFDVELDVLGPNNVVAVRVDRTDDKEEILEIENDFSRVAEWVRELAVERGNIDAAAS